MTSSRRRTTQPEHEESEEAIRKYLDSADVDPGRAALPQWLDEMGERQDASLSDEEALARAYSELRTARNER